LFNAPQQGPGQVSTENYQKCSGKRDVQMYLLPDLSGFIETEHSAILYGKYTS
jgi:hypothetical protein